MTEAAKKARAEYIRQWRRRNPEKMQKYSENYWEKIAAKQAETENDANTERTKAHEKS